MNKLLYRIARKVLLKTTPAGKSRKIYFGVLKNMNWVYSSGYSEYFMGNYETEVAEEFYRYSKKSKVVYDLGSNVGFYTLIAAKAVGAQGKVYAFEPLPQNIKALEKNVSVNQQADIEIYGNAVSNVTAELVFSNSDNNVANTLCAESPMFNEGKTITVKAVKLDDLVMSGKILPPDLIKMDIEGAEYEALVGAELLLKKYRPAIFLSTHNCQVKGVHKKCLDYLTGLGYSIRYLDYRENLTQYDDPWYEVLAEFN